MYTIIKIVNYFSTHEIILFKCVYVPEPILKKSSRIGQILLLNLTGWL